MLITMKHNKRVSNKEREKVVCGTGKKNLQIWVWPVFFYFSLANIIPTYVLARWL